MNQINLTSMWRKFNTLIVADNLILMLYVPGIFARYSEIHELNFHGLL